MSILTDVPLFQYDFAEEASTKLGKANGNIFYLKPGVENEHSGVVMVRLKKKRYVVLDYSFRPTAADAKLAAENIHCDIPERAGDIKCVTASCNRVGAPVCLYDSDPNENKSLYLRTGLCFECQRNLNEKRRTERKRKSDIAVETHPGTVMFPAGSAKKVKVNNKSLNMSNDAIILNGPLPGTKMCVDGFSAQEIGSDLYDNVHIALNETSRLVNSTTAEALAEEMPAIYEKAHEALYKSMYLLTQWKVAVEGPKGGDNGDAVDHNGNMVSLLLAANKKNDEMPFEDTQAYHV